MEQSPPLGQRPRLLLQNKALSFRLSPFEIITLLAVIAVGAFIGYNFYARSTDLNAAAEVAPTFLPAFRTTLTSNVSATGSVQASQQVTLTFGSTGKIKEFLVGLGQQVTAGQPLARIDDADLLQALKSTESSLASAEARFAAAVNPTQTDITSAQQSVASARASVTNAENNLNDLKAKPTTADINAGQQTILSGQNSLQSANDAVTKAQRDVTDAQTGVTNARTAVTMAQNSLTTARNAVTTAENNLSEARSELSTARTSMNTEHSELSIERGFLVQEDDDCDGNYSVPSLPSRGSTARSGSSLSVSFSCPSDSGTSATVHEDALAAAITKYNSAVSSYNSAVSTVNTRENAVTSAENAVDSAENGVTTAQNNVTKAEQDVTTAEQAVVTAQNVLTNGSLERSIQNAQLALSKAQQDYQETLAGAKPTEIAAAERSLESAQAGLANAEARFDDLLKPPPPDVMLPLQASVDEARFTVEEARKNLAGATIVAPFDGQISQVTGEVGAQVSATTAVFILLNPRLVRIDANVDQAYISTLQVGQPATVTFDALAGRNYQSTVSAIGLTPTTQQGVVSYVVTFAMDTSQLPTNTPIPAPGMSAQIRVTTTRTDNALVVPSRAVRRIGQNQTVTVKTADGGTEQRNVTTGTTNGTLIQITGGLDDGDEVLVTTTTTAASSGGGQQQTTGGGGGGGQFFIGGGGNQGR